MIPILPLLNTETEKRNVPDTEIAMVDPGGTSLRIRRTVAGDYRPAHSLILM